jgi:hypothetical protein
MTKLEQVARAIADYEAAFLLDTGCVNPGGKSYALGKALAAVEALREPTEGMQAAANSMTDLWPPKDIWYAMIDAILSEKPDAG